jgi:putative tricarboxylic transport membrane protein
MTGQTMRRGLVACAAAVSAIALGACGETAGGESENAEYPSERLSIMAPADPGGGWDETARVLQQAIRDSDVSTEGAEVYNVPGAGGTLGLSQLVSKNEGDPNQLMVMGLVMLGAIETNQSSVDLSQVTPISTLTEESEAIVVPADSPYRTLDDLMADLERDPASIAWAGGSAGGTDQLLVGLLARAAGTDPARTKYVAHAGGGEAIAAILSGSVDAGVSGVSEFADQVAAGKLRVLAVSGEEPVDVGGTRASTIEDEGYDVVLTNWRGIVAPPGLSDADREKVVAFVDELRATPSWKESVERLGWTEVAKSGSDFESFLQTEEQRVKQLVAELGLTAS